MRWEGGALGLGLARRRCWVTDFGLLAENCFSVFFWAVDGPKSASRSPAAVSAIYISVSPHRPAYFREAPVKKNPVKVPAKAPKVGEARKV